MALIGRWFGAPTPEVVAREHGPQVARLLRRMFGPRADIDDAFQAVFVEVFRALPTFAGRAQLGTWIHRIALNVAYQEMRLRYRDQSRLGDAAALDEIPCEREDAERALARAQSVQQLYGALESIDPRRRIAVILHDLEGKTLREVSELLGRPLQTVASQVKVGRAELAAYFRAAESVADRGGAGRDDGDRDAGDRDAAVRGATDGVQR